MARSGFTTGASKDTKGIGMKANKISSDNWLMPLRFVAIDEF